MPPPPVQNAKETREVPLTNLGALIAVLHQSLQQQERLVRLERAVAEVENKLEEHEASANPVLSAPEAIQASPQSTSGGASAYIALARIDTVEANCVDLRHTLRASLALVESTEVFLKTAIDHEAKQLWRELHTLRTQSTANLQRVEESRAGILARVQDVELAIAGSLNRGEQATLSVEKPFTEVGPQRAGHSGGLAHDLDDSRETKGRECDHVTNHASPLSEETNLQVHKVEEEFHRQPAEVLQLQLQELKQVQLRQSTETVAALVRHEETMQKHVEELTSRLLIVEAKIPCNDTFDAAAIAPLTDVQHQRKPQAPASQGVSGGPASRREDEPGGAGMPCSREAGGSLGSNEATDFSHQERMLWEFTSQLSSTESTLAGDMRHVLEMLVKCVAMLQTRTQDLGPRVGSLEGRFLEMSQYISQWLHYTKQQQLQFPANLPGANGAPHAARGRTTSPVGGNWAFAPGAATLTAGNLGDACTNLSTTATFAGSGKGILQQQARGNVLLAHGKGHARHFQPQERHARTPPCRPARTHPCRPARTPPSRPPAPQSRTITRLSDGRKVVVQRIVRYDLSRDKPWQVGRCASV